MADREMQRCEHRGPGLTCERKIGHQMSPAARLHSAATKDLSGSVYWDDDGNLIPGTYYRASGDMICETCNKPYRKHPNAPVVTSEHGETLKRICNGDLVKL